MIKQTERRNGEYRRDVNPGASTRSSPGDPPHSPSPLDNIPANPPPVRSIGSAGSRTVITSLSADRQGQKSRQPATGRHRVHGRIADSPQPNPHPGQGLPPEVTMHKGSTSAAVQVEQVQAGPKHFFYYVHIPKAGGSSVNRQARFPTKSSPLAEATKTEQHESLISHCPPPLPAHFPPTAVRYFWSGGGPSGITPCNQTDLYRGAECPHVAGGPQFCQRLLRELSHEKRTGGEYRTCNFLTHETEGFDRFRRSRLRDSLLPDLKAITFLREPISHYLSQYKGSFIGTKKGNPSKNLRLQEYMEGGYGYGGGGNMMTNRLLGMPSGSISPELLARQKLMENFFMFGIVEQWSQSFCLLSFQLGQFRRDLCEGLCRAGPHSEYQPNHNAPAQNTADSLFLAAGKANAAAAHPLAANLTHIWTEGLGMDMLERIRRINRADLSLYTWAVEVFKARVRHVERAEGVRLLCDEWGTER